MSNEYGSGSFPTMGVSAAQLAHVAMPEKGRSRPKGSKASGEPAQPTKSNRGQVYGRMGASLHPVMKTAQSNDPNAGLTLRNVVQIPSKSSWTDSWRSAARSLQG